MANFDGTFFGAIDSAAVDPDEPLDAWLEHQLADSERERYQNFGSHVTWSPITGRQLTSYTWSIIRYVPLIIDPSVDAIDSSVAASFNLGTEARFRLLVTDGRRDYFDTDVLYSVNSPSIVESVRIQGSFDQKPATEVAVAMLVMMQGELDAGGRDTASGDFLSKSRFYKSDNTELTSVRVKEHQAHDHIDGEDRADILQDMETVSDPDSSDPDDGRYAVISEGLYQKTAAESEHDSFAYDISLADYEGITLHGFDFELTYSDDVSLKTEPTQGAEGPLAGKRKYDAATSSYQHAQATKRTTERPRLLSIGYRGNIRDDNDNWPENAPELWGYAKGDNTTDTIVNEQSLGLLHRGDWDWEARLAYAAFDLSDTNVRVGEDDSMIDRTIAEADSSKWALKASIDQHQGGSSTPTSISSNTVDVSADHYPADNTGRQPLPTIVWYLFNGHTQTNSYPTNLAYIYREGQLYEQDLGLVRTLTIPISNATTVQRPALFSLEATGYTDNGVSASDAVFVLLGMSIYTVPP